MKLSIKTSLIFLFYDAMIFYDFQLIGKYIYNIDKIHHTKDWI